MDVQVTTHALLDILTATADDPDKRQAALDAFLSEFNDAEEDQNT